MDEILRAFLMDHCIQNPSSAVSLVDLLGSYRTWAIARGHRPPTKWQVIQALETLGFQVGRKRSRLHAIGLSLRKPPLQVIDGKITRAAI